MCKVFLKWNAGTLLFAQKPNYSAHILIKSLTVKNSCLQEKQLEAFSLYLWSITPNNVPKTLKNYHVSLCVPLFSWYSISFWQSIISIYFCNVNGIEFVGNLEAFFVLEKKNDSRNVSSTAICPTEKNDSASQPFQMIYKLFHYLKYFSIGLLLFTVLLLCIFFCMWKYYPRFR